MIFKNCTPFIDCINEISNTHVFNASDLDSVIQMYNLIEYSDNYAKTEGSLWQYCKESFKFKSKFTNKTDNAGSAYIKIAVPLK